MKFNLPTPEAPLDPSEELVIGNVYAAKGGNKTRYWVVVGIRDSTVILLGLNADGELSSAATYGAHVFSQGSRYNRPVLGRCEGIEELNFDIVWREKP